MDFQAHAFGCQLQHDLVKNVQWVSTWVSVGNVCRFNRHGHRSGGVSHDCNVQWSKMRGNVKPVITDQLLEQSHSKTDNEIQQNHNTCIPDCMYNPAQKDRVLPKPVQNRFPTTFSQRRIWPSSKHHNVRLYCPFQCTIFTKRQCINQLSECSYQMSCTQFS